MESRLDAIYKLLDEVLEPFIDECSHLGIPDEHYEKYHQLKDLIKEAVERK